MKRVLVCGGRDFSDARAVNLALDLFMRHNDLSPQNVAVVQGGARGADALAKAWAKKNGFCCIEIAAPWDFYQMKAGPVRNGWMLVFTRPDYVIAFPGGNGTRDMKAQSKQAGINVWEPLP